MKENIAPYEKNLTTYYLFKRSLAHFEFELPK